MFWRQPLTVPASLGWCSFSQIYWHVGTSAIKIGQINFNFNHDFASNPFLKFIHTLVKEYLNHTQ